MNSHLVCLLSPTSFEAEQYRTLRHLVELMHKDTGLQVLAVTSPAAGDGKTTTAINLAGALAQSPEARVLLVCVDLRRPSVPQHLGIGSARTLGLVDAILNPAVTLMAVVQRLDRVNLSVLPSGPCPADPYEILKSPRLGELLAEARQRYDYIVLDTPPLILVPDCRIIEKWADSFLIVVAAHKTPRKLLGEALNLMDPVKVIGLVFNNDDRPLAGYYYNDYSSYYGQTRNSHKAGLWDRMVKTVGDSLRRSRSSRSQP